MKYIARIILLLSTAIFAFPASASLSDRFTDHFESATVQTGGSGTFELNGRTLHSGGYVRIRIPTVGAPNPVKFQAPGIKGGCNGFDIYGGSFSYISADEIITWLNAVVNNAAALGTYMFMTYMQEMCSVCGEVMQTLYAMQDMLNTAMQDSCTTATAMVDGISGMMSDEPKETPAWDAYSQGVQKSAQQFSNQVENTYDDAVSLMRDSEEKVDNVTKKIQPDAMIRTKELYGGNMLYWVIEETDILDNYKTIWNDSSLTKSQLMTYLTAVVGNQADFLDEASADTTATSLGTYSSKVKVVEFVNSSFVDNTIPADCGSTWPSTTFCKDPSDIKFKDGFADVKPFIDRFKCVMEGKNSKGVSCGSTGGVLGKLGRSKDEVGTLSSEEMQFIRDFLPGFNFGAMMVDLSSSSAAMTQFYECTGEIMMYDFAVTQMNDAVDLVRSKLEGIKFGTGKGGDRKSNYANYLNSRKDALLKEYRVLEKNLATNSNCSVGHIDTFLKFKEYSEAGSK